MTTSARFTDRPVLPEDLPPALVRVARTMPVVAALAEIVGPGSPRWAYGSWALDLVGPLRSQPRMRPEDHEAVQRAVNEIETLAALVNYLDGLAGVQDPPQTPDCPASLLASRALRWPVLRREIYPFTGDPTLTGLPRAMPPLTRGDNSLAVMDARVAAVAALVRSAADRGRSVDYSPVFALVSWSVGTRRADCGSATRTGPLHQPGEHNSFGVTDAAALLAAGDPVRLTGDLLAAVRGAA